MKDEVIMNWVEGLIQAGVIIVVLICISGVVLICWDLWNEKKNKHTQP